MKKYLQVKSDQYPFIFVFAVGYDDDEIIQKVSRRFKIKMSDYERSITSMPCDNQGQTTHYGGSLCLIRFNDFDDSPEDHGRLSHEIHHAVQFMMEWIGTKLTQDTSESYAYLDQYLTEKFIKEMRNAKDRGNKKRAHKK